MEITLLGQNVNAYRHGGHHGFADLLRACGEVAGLRRVRFTSPHPRDFTDDVIEAMAQTPNVMPQLHMPLQSGSDDVLRRMRRSYRAQRYLGNPGPRARGDAGGGDHHGHHRRIPRETEVDFQATLEVVEQSRFAGAYTFQYSPRPGTPAAEYPDQVPHAVVQERYERLVERVDAIAWEQNQNLVGREVEVLVSVGRDAGQRHRPSDRPRR